MLKWFYLFISLMVLWQCVIWIFNLPPFILPAPLAVLQIAYEQWYLLLQQLLPTLIEILAGLIIGSIAAVLLATNIILFPFVNRWLMHVIILSQSLPIFAIAPLLVMWFGYGILSKIIVTAFMLFFPVTSAFVDGLRRTNITWLEMSEVMQAASTWHVLIYIRFPAALPALATGLRMAAAIAPLGAVVGEWVGASRGLGFLILNANARVQIDMMFAALILLMIMSIVLYWGMNKLLVWLIPWQKEVH